MVLLSTVLVTHSQLWAENVQWKIQEVNSVKLHCSTGVLRSASVPLRLAQDVTHLFVQRPTLPYAPRPLVT